MRILHLSDLHSYSKALPLHQAVLEGALSKALELHETHPFELLVVSGDLAMSGTRDDYLVAQKEFLDPFVEALGIARERLVLVPGNHDVDTTLIDEIHEAGLLSVLDSSDRLSLFTNDVDALDKALTRQAPWFDFYGDYLSRPHKNPQEKLVLSRTIEIDDTNVGIVEVNSAWRATGAPNDGDKGKLLTAAGLVADHLALIRDADVRLVVMHHPPSWLRGFEQNALENALEKDGTIVLTGHEHFADPRVHLTVSGVAAYVRSGCLFGGTGYRNEFAVLDLDVPEHRLAVSLYGWVPEQRRFAENHDKTPGGEVVYALPNHPRSADRYRPRRSVALRALARLATETFVYTGTEEPKAASDVLIEPRFYPVSYAEAVALSSLSTGKGDEIADVEPSRPLEVIAESQATIIVADAGTGLTSALLWLAETVYEADYRQPPVYVPYRHRAGPDPFERQIIDRYTVHGIDHPLNAPLPPLLVTIDDLGAQPLQTYERLAKHIEKNASTKYLLAADEGSASEIHAALEAAGVSATIMHLGPLGRPELRQLVSKIGKPGLEERVDAILETAFSCGLPRNGFVMSVLVQVLASDPTFKPPNESTLLALFIDNLLGKHRPDFRFGASGLDGRDFEILVGNLAEHFIRNALTAMPRAELENHVNQFYVDRGNSSVSGGHVVDFLVTQRILTDGHGGVGFSHRAVLDLCAARQSYEEEQFRTLLLENPLAYRPVLQHAAALRRHDVGILRRVMEETIDVLLAQDHRVLLDDLHRENPLTDSEVVGRLEIQAESIKPLTQEEHEKRLDRRIEALEQQNASAKDAPILPDDLTVLLESLHFLAEILAASERVDDAELKLSILRSVLSTSARAYDSMAIESAKSDDLKSVIAARLEHENRAPTDEIVEKMSRIVLTFAGGFFLAGRLDSSGLQVPLERLLDDQDFMSSPVQALYATLLNCRLRPPDWARRLIAVHEMHGKTSVIGEVTRSLIIGFSFSPTVRESDATALHKCIADEAARGVADGPQAVGRRSLVRSEVLQRLRTERLIRKESRGQMGLWDLLGSD